MYVHGAPACACACAQHARCIHTDTHARRERSAPPHAHAQHTSRTGTQAAQHTGQHTSRTTHNTQHARARREPLARVPHTNQSHTAPHLSRRLAPRTSRTREHERARKPKSTAAHLNLSNGPCMVSVAKPPHGAAAHILTCSNGPIWCPWTSTAYTQTCCGKQTERTSCCNSASCGLALLDNCLLISAALIAARAMLFGCRLA